MFNEDPRSGLSPMKCEACKKMMMVSNDLKRQEKPMLCSRKKCKAARGEA